MGKTTDIYIVRHGQTSLNKSALLQGRSDHPLTEEGEEQAIVAGKWLSAQNISFDIVYTSPLIRAVHTAELMTGICCQEPDSVQTYTDQRLIEMDYGPYEGISSWKTWEFLQRTDMIPEYRKKSWKKSVSSEQA